MESSKLVHLSCVGTYLDKGVLNDLAAGHVSFFSFIRCYFVTIWSKKKILIYSSSLPSLILFSPLRMSEPHLSPSLLVGNNRDNILCPKFFLPFPRLHSSKSISRTILFLLNSRGRYYRCHVQRHLPCSFLSPSLFYFPPLLVLASYAFAIARAPSSPPLLSPFSPSSLSFPFLSRWVFAIDVASTRSSHLFAFLNLSPLSTLPRFLFDYVGICNRCHRSASAGHTRPHTSPTWCDVGGGCQWKYDWHWASAHQIYSRSWYAFLSYFLSSPPPPLSPQKKYFENKFQ